MGTGFSTFGLSTELPAVRNTILDTGVKKDLTGLGNLKNLKTVQLRKDYFFGGQEAIDALVALLPDVTVSINAD